VTYNVGSVYLQVVPSFRNVQNLIRAEAKEAARTWDDEFAKNSDPSKSMSKSFDRVNESAKKSGDQSGRSWADYFEKIVRGRVERALADLPKIKVDADTSAADRNIALIRAELETLRKVKISADVDATTVVAELDRIQDKLRRMSTEEARLEVRADSASAVAQLEEVLKVAKRVDGKKTRIEIDVDGAAQAVAELAAVELAEKAAGDGARGAGGGFDDAGTSFRAFNGVLLGLVSIGPAAIPILAALAGGALAIGPAMVGAAAGVGVLYLAFSGISKAVQALTAQQKNAQNDALTTGKAMEGAANGVRNAEQALARAREQSARSAEDSSRRVADAEQNVVDAQEAAARSAEDSRDRQAAAARDVGDAFVALARTREQAARDISAAADREATAERNLADAQVAVLKAQEDLTRARDGAQNDLEDLSSAVQRGNIDERQTVLDLADAQDRLAKMLADPKATAADRAEAALAVERITLRLEDQRRENQRLAEQQAAAVAAGVEGSDRVKTAQERLTDAIQAQADATAAVATAAENTRRVQTDAALAVAGAERNLADARADQARVSAEAAQAAVDSAHRIADAQQSLADAQKSQSRAAQDSARSIAMAQQGLADAQRSYAEAGQKMSASARNTADAMAQLGPEGQKFATFIATSILPGLAKLRGVAEAGVLPGVMELFRDLGGTYGAGFVRFIGTMAGVLGDLFRALGQALISPTFREFFATMEHFVPIFTAQFGTILINIAKGFAGLMTALAPFTKELGDALIHLTDSFAKFGAGASDPNSGLQAFLGYVREVGPKVMEFFGALVGALANLGVALAPLGGAILSGLTGLLRFIANMNPEVLQAVVLAIGGLILAVQVSQGITALATSFENLGKAVKILTGAQVGGGAIFLIIAGLVLVGVALYELYKHSETFRDIVNAVWDAVKVAFGLMVDGMKWAWENALKPTFNAIQDAGVWMWENVLKPTWAALGAAWDALLAALQFAWEHVLRPVFEAIGDYFTFIYNVVLRPLFAVWELEWAILLAALQFVWEHVLRPVFEAIGDVLSDVYTGILRPTFGFIADRFAELGAAIRVVWDTVLRPTFDFLADVFTTRIQPAFTAGVSAIQSIWNGLVAIARGPIEFIVNTVINGGIIDTFNRVARFFDTTEIDHVPLPAGWNSSGIPQGGSSNTKQGVANKLAGGNFADGGVVGGWSPTPKADNIHALLTAGEYVQPVDVVQHYGVDFMEALRRKALPRFANGGLVSGVSNTIGDAINIGESLAGKFKRLFGDVGGYLRSAVEGLFSKIPGGNAGQALAAMPKKLLQMAIDKALSVLGLNDGPPAGTAILGMGALGDVGSSSTDDLIAYLGNSGVPFTVTSTTGGQHAEGSYHYQGRAVDFVGPNMDAIFRAFLPIASSLKELFYTPEGFSVKNGARTSPIAAADHYDHVHVAYADGGLVRPRLYDSGGVVPPGLSTILNLTGGNETAAVLTPQQLATVQGGRAAGDGGEFTGTLYLDDGAFVGQVKGVLREQDRADLQTSRAGA
jgi:hypothetical protein